MAPNSRDLEGTTDSQARVELEERWEGVLTHSTDNQQLGAQVSERASAGAANGACKHESTGGASSVESECRLRAAGC